VSGAVFASPEFTSKYVGTIYARFTEIGVIAGIASGAAMLPYTVIKEANPPNMALAIVLTLLLKEAGPAVRTTATHQERIYEPKNGHGKIRRATN
jgi:hypothetical protein